MSSRKNIQDVIPEDYRGLIEAVPRGFLRHSAYGALLFGGLLGSLAVYIVPGWLVSTVVLVLLIGFHLFKRKSDKLYDQRMGELKSRGLDWKIDQE